MAGTDELAPLDQLVADLNWADCARKVNVADPAELAHIVELFDRCDHLVQRFPNTGLRKKRDKFVKALFGALESAGAADEVARLEVRLGEGALFERCFHELIKTLPKTAAGRLPPDRHAWALIDRFARQNDHIEAQLLRTMAKEKRVFDPFAFMAESDDGTFYRPDVILSRLSDVTASSLTMLAITNGWISDAGLVVIPARSNTPSEEDIYAAGITEVLGNSFDGIGYLAERWRFWGDSVTEGEVTAVGLDGATKTIKAVSYLPRFQPIELYDHIATERLNRFIIQNLEELNFEGNVDKRVGKVGETVAQAPEQYVSKDEAFAAVGLCSLLNFNILDDSATYGGLRLTEWLRGYAWLRARAPKDGGRVERISEKDATDELLNVSLTREAATAFLRHASLHKGRSDLFDTPLIRTQDDAFLYHPGVMKSANLPRIVLSRLSSLQVAIAQKGLAFELATLKVFTDAGLPAKSFSFKRDGETYQYDAAFVWDDVLFVLECKSYSIPMLRPMQLFWFVTKMTDAVEQVQRLGKAAEAYPDEIRTHLGKKATWKSVVTCVVNSLPWSMGKLDGGTFILDFSGIGRFFQERTLSVKVPAHIGNAKVLVRHHVKELWPESGPTATHFLDAMDTPWQVKSIASSFKAEPAQFPLSETLMFHGGFLKRSAPDIAREFGVLGVPDPTPELEAIHQQIAKLRVAVDARRKDKQRLKNKPKRKPKPKRKRK